MFRNTVKSVKRMFSTNDYNNFSLSNYQFEELKRGQGKKIITLVGLTNTSLLLFLTMNLLAVNYKLDKLINKNVISNDNKK